MLAMGALAIALGGLLVVASSGRRFSFRS
jgi:hypothetical protein